MLYEGTGVSEYTKELVLHLLKSGTNHSYVLFLSTPHLHLKEKIASFFREHAQKTQYMIKTVPIPPKILEFLWNRLHVLPVEWLIGQVDVFFSSDWVEPPTLKAGKVTTIHDLTVLKMPELFDSYIVSVHRRKLAWVAKESAMIFCDSRATKRDVETLLHISSSRLRVVYPGVR